MMGTIGVIDQEDGSKGHDVVSCIDRRVERVAESCDVWRQIEHAQASRVDLWRIRLLSAEKFMHSVYSRVS